MKKKIFYYLFFILYFSSFLLFSQDLHHLKQKKGTEKRILDVFNHYRLDTTSNYIYVLILPPAHCPRCEGVINPLFDYIRQSDKSSKIYLFVFFPRSKALEKYLIQKSFTPDKVIILKDNTFLENFWISTGSIQVPYITKFERKTGKLLCVSSLLGIRLDPNFIKWLVECSYPNDKQEYDSNVTVTSNIDFKKYISNQIGLLNPIDSFDVVEDTSHPISKVYYLSLGSNIEQFSFQDFLSSTLHIFEKKGKLYLHKGEILPSPKEETYFIAPDIPKNYVSFLKINNILVSMYFNSTIINDKIYISASLPVLKMEIKDNDTNLSYFNSPSICIKNLNNLQLDRIITFKKPANLVGTISHIGFVYDTLNKVFFLPFDKGWPNTGTDTEILKDTSLNPFYESFYFNSPLYAIFDSSFNFRGFFGLLDDFYKRHKLGYFYNVPTIFIDKGGYFVTSGLTGKIYFYSSINSKLPTDSFQIFNLPINLFHNNYDYRTRPLDYILAFREFLSYSILDIFTNKDNLYCLIQNLKNQETFLSITNRASRNQSYYAIPEYILNYKLEVAKLSFYDGNMIIFAIYTDKDTGKRKIYIFKI